MERNPTARAMEWSVELEKGLRSKTPLRQAQAISDFGPRLLQWSRDPRRHSLSPAVHHLFDLIPGEDRLFANAVLLRLADAFRFGDLRTRVCVAEVFLAECRERAKRKGRGGLLSKERARNCSELLGRVKDVYENGDDVESRSLALCLFGCWASFAAESSNVRYLVLSSMVSSHASEAKAALFAGGCFCDESDDFPFIFLEMLLNLMTSCEPLSPVKLAAAHVYAKLGNSHSTATKSYKAGLKILLDSTEEDFQVALLVSLSKIASRSSTLMSDQVNFLVSLLRQEKKSPVAATALRCLLFIFSKGVSQLSLQTDVVKVLLNVLDESDLPANVHFEALKILRKIILYTQSCAPCDILDPGKLTTIAGNAFVTEFTSMTLLALYIQVDISKRCTVRKVLDPGVLDPFRIPQQAVMLILRQITSLINSLIGQADSVKFQKISQLFHLLLSVVQEDQGLALLVLDQLVLLVRHVDSDFMDTTHAETIGQDNIEVEGEERKAVTSKLMCNVYRFLVSSLESPNSAGGITMHVFDGVKRLVENVCKIKFQDRYISTKYSMLLHSPVLWGHSMNKNDKRCTVEENSQNNLAERELITLDLTKRILAEKNYWVAYKVGRYLACQGAWLSSSIVFKHLITQVSSDSCRCWLKALFNFACSGRKATLMFPEDKYSSLADMAKATNVPLEIVFDDLKEIGYDGTNPLCKLSCSKVVLSAYMSIFSAKEALEAGLTLGKIFCFQRWFLSLRAKTLRLVVDVLETLETIPFLWEENGTSWTDVKNSVVQYLSLMGQVSLRMKRLAKEFDLLGSSFIDMDTESSKCISDLVLAVSLLGFITSFPRNFEKSVGLKNSEDKLFAHEVQNLAARLCFIDPDTSTQLVHLIDNDKATSKSCFHSLSRNQPANVCFGAGDILGVCRYSASEISCLRSKADEIEDEENMPRFIQDGLRLTVKLLDLWMRIPFRIPKCFFRIRPCIGSELFAVSVNKNPDAICVSQGYRLSLSVCLQLRNMASYIPFRPAKLHCILYSSTSFQEPSRAQHHGWESNEFVEMNDVLLHHMKNSAARNTNNRKTSSSGNKDCGFVSSFIRCEPNEVGQGFSSCLLDVSRFPLGSYRIKWQCCCIDNQSKIWNLLPVNSGPVFTVK